MKSVFYLLVVIFLFSCTDPVSEDTPTSGTGSVGFCQTGPCLGMVMSDALELTISITNFEKAVSILSFELIFDPSALQLNSYVGADFGAPAYSMNEVSDSTFASFSFYNNISNSGNLLDLVFQSRGSYDESVIFFKKN